MNKPHKIYPFRLFQNPQLWRRPKKMFTSTTVSTMDIPSTTVSLDANNNENVDLNLQRNEKYSLRQRYKRAAAVESVSGDLYTSHGRQSTGSASKQRGQGIHAQQRRPAKKGKPFLSVDDLHSNQNSLGVACPLSPTSSVTSSSSRSSYDTTKSVKDKPKTKAPPLSKYRRKTANARERTRMREINSAFENLRKCVPMTMCLSNNASHFDPLFLTTHQAPGSQVQVTTPGNEKLTKITTLKLAMKYIRMLTEVLNGSMPMGDTLEVDGNNNGLSLAVGGAASKLLKTSLLSIKVPPTQSPKKTAQHNTNLLLATIAAATGKAQKVRSQANSASAIMKSGGGPTTGNAVSYNPFAASAGDLLFGSPCLTPPIDDSSSAASDLAMLLDSASDEDSLKLSESCLSPPLSEQNIKVSFNSMVGDHHSHPDLELGFLLESDSDTLQLSEPCLSPLTSALDPFGDLLTSGFNEQTVLDMYL